MVVVVVMVTHCSELEVGLAIFSAFYPLIVIFQEVEGCVSVHGNWGC
jgi:hypothetical protein